MSADDLCFVPAHVLRSQIASKELSPVDLIEAVIARAERVDEQINFIALPRFEQAREAAVAAEAALARSESLGPLHGIPITIKDNVPTAGDVTTVGSYAFEHNVAHDDAEMAKRLKAAGAIVYAKTTTPEFAHRVLTESPLHGVTRSPWSPEHTPGGSSGGASAAVAAGCGPLAQGTDGGGSIRCPASCTGIVGIKPTLGRIPFELMPDGFGNYAFTGPMARTVDDAALMLAVMSGPLGADPWTLAVPALPAPDAPVRGSVAGLRVAWIERFGAVPLDPEVATATGDAVAALSDAGARVEAVVEPAFADVFEYYAVIATAAHGGRLSGLLEQWGERITPSMRSCIEQGRSYSAAQLVQASDRRTALFRRVESLLEAHDLIVTPTLNAPPKTVDENGAINSTMYSEWAVYLYPFNLTGHPAASVPVGFTSAGLPVGLQLVGPWYSEPRLLETMAWLEANRPWAARRPPV